MHRRPTLLALRGFALSRQDGPWHVAAAIALVLLALVAGQYPYWRLSTVAVDHATYLAAFARVAAGQSPYAVPEYLYPPAFAVVGAAAQRWLGAWGVVVAMRALSWLAAPALLWLAWWDSRLPWALRVVIAAVFAALSPLLDDGLRLGNLSIVFTCTALISLRLERRSPIAGGALLGACNALKPLTLPLLISSVVPSRGERLGSHRLRFAGSAVAAGLVVLALGARYLPGMLARAVGQPTRVSNLSVTRALWAWSLRMPPALVAAAFLLGLLALLRRRSWSMRERIALGCTTSVLVLPVVNPNTLVLAFPATFLALERLGGGGWPRDLASRATVAVVLAATLSVQGAVGVAATGGLPQWAQGVVALMPPSRSPGSLSSGCSVRRGLTACASRRIRGPNPESVTAHAHLEGVGA